MITNGDYPAAKHNCVMNVPRPIEQSAHAPRSLHLDAWAHAGMYAQNAWQMPAPAREDGKAVLLALREG
jgi:hypothetical protein